MSERLISHVSDTARWIAAHRAEESARPDALFRDHLAERLAGELGRALAAKVPRSTRNGWPWTIRTRLIDDLIAASLHEGCDRVLNLAAGLDTRPYRLDLPATLTWVEADLPGMVAEKEQLLADERPRCQLVRQAVDLTDATARAAFLDEALHGAARALVITEGLLGYLEPAVVRSIASDLSARPAIRWWIKDMSSPAIHRMLLEQMGSQFEHAPFKSSPPPNGVAYLEAFGWRARDIRSIFREAARLRRLPLWLRPLAFLTDADPRNLGNRRWSAIVRFERL